MRMLHIKLYFRKCDPFFNPLVHLDRIPYASILCNYYFEEYRQYKIKGQIARLFLIQLIFNTFRS